MLGNRLYEVQKFLRDNGILISFSGRLSQGLIEEYGEAVKKYLETEERPKSEVYNVFAIYIEQTQNIKNYVSAKLGSPNYEAIGNSSIVTIGRAEDGYYICSGNMVENEDLPQLLERIDRMAGMDKAELKKLYKEAIMSEQPGETSAGLGMIEMARKASKPLEYTVTPLEGALSFFSLKAVI
ncbi:SiaB family protein kinase [Gorillibacterium sp. sgz5001074]|uniref:SiaB family protein kinase n=1 Tax=Gorillibacterium sp. sgz5001074 TaxID=3446695 RepID=UPI003F67C67C